MSHIYPLVGQKHFDIDRELTELGGERSKNFRIAYAWDGEHFFEVTDDDDGVRLYEGWLDLHGGVIGSEPGENGNGEAVSAQPAQADAPAAPVEPTAQAAGKSTSKSTADSSEKSTKQSESEPPVASTEEATADSQETAPVADEVAKEEPESEPKADSTTSGTARKRSAKNSNRRS